MDGEAEAEVEREVSRPTLPAITGLAFLGALVVGVWLYMPYDSWRGKTYETYEARQSSVLIRIVAQHEKSYLLNPVPGAYFTFLARPAEGDWHEIMRFRHDDPIAIQKENVRSLKSGVTYLFMGWKYAVTTDAGMTWSVWDAHEDARIRYCSNYGLIEDVTVREDGTGVMKLRSAGTRCPVATLATNDFGRTWN